MTSRGSSSFGSWFLLLHPANDSEESVDYSGGIVRSSIERIFPGGTFETNGQLANLFLPLDQQDLKP